MPLFLRWLKYTLRRVVDSFIGGNLPQFRRLVKAGRIAVGEHTYGVPIVNIYDYDQSKLTIGKYCSLSETALIMLGGQHPINHVSQYPFRINWGLPGAGKDGNPEPSTDTVIGNDVIINQRVFIRSGVTIGDGALIGSNANVTKDVPPYAIMGGNPAKVIRYRATPEQIEALLEIKWWDWSKEDVIDSLEYIVSDDIDRFIAYARERFGPKTSSSAASER